MRELCSVVTILGWVVFSAADSPKEVRYGKYFSLSDGSGTERDYSDNSYYLFSPPRNIELSVPALLPIVVHLYGCGWKNCLTPWKTANPTAGGLISNGIAVASVGYRRITTQYWYDDPNASLGRSPEELVHVDDDGKVYLDKNNLTWAGYEFRVSRHEAIVKPTYDTVMALEHMILNAFDLGLDMNRLVFWCYSAGGTMAQYLTYVYHQWNPGRFTPLGLLYNSPMLDIPTANILDRVWYLIKVGTKDGGNTKLKDLLEKKTCRWEVGNGCHDPLLDKWYSPDFPYTACNDTWNQLTMEKYCGEHFDTTTVDELMASQRWPREDPEVGLGMEKIWYASKNMLKYVPKPFYVHLFNRFDDYALLHSSLYVSAFKYFLRHAGVQYTAYYDVPSVMNDWSDPQASAIENVVLGDGHSVSYQSTFGWRDMMSQAGITAAGDTDEGIRFACFALSQPQCSPQFAGANTVDKRMLLEEIIHT